MGGRATFRDVFAVAHLRDGRAVKTEAPTQIEVYGDRLTFWFPLRAGKGGTVDRVTVHLGKMRCTLAVNPPVPFGADSMVTIIQPLEIDSLVPG